MKWAVVLAVYGLLAFTAGLSTAAWLLWGPVAAAAAMLLVTGACSVAAALLVDFDPRKE